MKRIFIFSKIYGKQFRAWCVETRTTASATINKWQRLLEKDEAEHWSLVKDPCDYKYSSARYYELNEKNFSFLKDLWEAI